MLRSKDDLKIDDVEASIEWRFINAIKIIHIVETSTNTKLCDNYHVSIT